MSWFDRVKETVNGVVDCHQGCIAGEEWLEQGGGAVGDREVHQFLSRGDVKVQDYHAFSKGFKAVAGDADEE